MLSRLLQVQYLSQLAGRMAILRAPQGHSCLFTSLGVYSLQGWVLAQIFDIRKPNSNFGEISSFHVGAFKGRS